MASLGLPFTLTEVRSRETLAACTPDLAAFRVGNMKYPGALDFAQFVYWRDSDTIHARMFAPLDNITEDPATGSAAATLAALLIQLEGQAQQITLLQGEDMGRPSRIGLSASSSGVTVSGDACVIMEGRFTTAF